MSFSLILLTAFALAMDAFAVAVATGAILRTVTFGQVLRMSLCFGFFQAGMPIIGWLAGSAVYKYIAAYDHWIAFVLLGAIGAHMSLEGFAAYREARAKGLCLCEIPANGPAKDPTRGYTLLVLGIATSIDALAVGISLSMVEAGIMVAALVIGVVCALVTSAGLYLGAFACRNQYLSHFAGILGGFVLIGIGAKILVEHGVFS